MTQVLAVDIGGTHASFAIVDIRKKLKILELKQYSTQQVLDFTQLVKQFLDQSSFKPKKACFAAAGIVKNDTIKMSNANIIIDCKKIVKNTSLTKAIIINDFQALSYGVKLLAKKDIIVVNKGIPQKNGTIGVIGAGTGLGKAILYYNTATKQYESLASEGGHADLPLITKEDQDIAMHIRAEKKKKTYVLSYEDVLSGRGVESLYTYLAKRYKNVPAKLPSKQITTTKKKNKCSLDTLKLLAQYYARCTRNFALEILPRGGIYIAGGIANNNPEIFNTAFLKTFQRHAHPNYKEFLTQVPIYVVKNYNVSIYGAAFTLKREM